MPYKSKRQQRAMHAKLERHEISAKVVREFDQATKGHYDELPEKAPARSPKPKRKGR